MTLSKRHPWSDTHSDVKALTWLQIIILYRNPPGHGPLAGGSRRLPLQFGGSWHVFLVFFVVETLCKGSNQNKLLLLWDFLSSIRRKSFHCNGFQLVVSWALDSPWTFYQDSKLSSHLLSSIIIMNIIWELSNIYSTIHADT